MGHKENLKDYEDQAASLNPGDRWRESIASNKAGGSSSSSKTGVSTADTVTNTQNQDIVRKKESELPSTVNFTGGGNKTKGKLSGGKGPLIAIFGGLSVSVIVIGMVGNMFSSILVNMKETLFNDAQSGASRTNKVYGDAAFAKKFTKGVCTNKVAIICKFNTVSKRQITKMERAGFKLDIEESKIPGRYNLKGGEFPDGSKFSDARTFNQLANSSPNRAKAVRYATLGKTSYYLNKKFDNILERFKINKTKKLNGSTKEDNDSDINKETNGVDSKGKSDAEIKEEANKQTQEKVKEQIQTNGVAKITKRIDGGLKWLAAPVILGCGAYNMSHMLTAYAKQYHIEQMAKYAMIFLNTADRIKSEGDLTPEIASYVGDLLTQADPRATITDPNGKTVDNPDYGKTATDAQAYEIAAHGDQSDLTPEAQKFKANGYQSDSNTSWLNSLSEITKSMEVGAATFNPASSQFLNIVNNTSGYFGRLITNNFDFVKTSKETARSNNTNITEGQQAIRYLCIKGQDAALTGYIAFCGMQVVNAASIALGNPEAAVGWGALAGCALAAACEGAKYVPLPKNCSDATEYVAKKALDLSDELGLTDVVLKYLQDGLVGSFLKYTDVGNAFGAGESFIGEKTANGYGLRPAKDVAETKEFIVSTNKDIAIENQIAVEDAKLTPFDITNPYSFLGTTLRSAQLYYDSRTPVFSGIASLLRIVPASLNTGDTAMAYYNQPVMTPNDRYDCNDTDLIDIGILNADKFCNTVGITPTGEIEAARQQSTDANNGLIEDTINYMVASQAAPENQGGTLDDSFCDIPGGDFLSGGLVSTATNDGTCKKVKEDSSKPSIDENGAPIPDSQYSKYIKYCTDERQWPWGTFGEEIQEAKSTRDIDWFSGKQCLKDTKMMQNFRTYFNMCAQLATMDDTSSCFEETATLSGNSDACSLLDNANIVLINPETKKGVEEICKTGHAINLCGKDFTLNPILIQTMTQLSSKYKVWVNNFGFKGDRDNPTDCTSDTFQHPKGNAVDLNGIEMINGGGRAGGDSWGDINFSANQIPAVEAYANDWIATLPPTRGGVGQQGCGSFKVNFPAAAQLVNGAAFFPDPCNHLHIDVRDRSNLRAV